MKKIFLGLGAAALAAGALASCGKTNENVSGKISDSKVFHIYVWNEEFKGFFEKYLSDEAAQFVEAAEKEDATLKPKVTHYKGKEVKWTINPSDGGVYQQKLDVALRKNAKASDADKVDMFLAEADYILKYSNSIYTKDVTDLGVTDFSNIYDYTKQVASDSTGAVKGVSFQCCPAGVIYRRSIAKAVLGTDDPAEVQKKIANWSKFNDVAKQMKDKGYLMTSSFAETYRAFSNNTEKAWVDDENYLQFDAQINAWMDQAIDYYSKGYTLTAGVWDDECTAEMFKTGKTFCWFGPAWYYNFCMGNAQDKEKGCFGDWALCEGPAAYYWGGTWIQCPAGGNDDFLVSQVMNEFINNKELCKKLVKNEGQFSNNKLANQEVADEYDKEGTGNAFLGGQNDTKLYLELAKNIQVKNQTIYDQYCNEGIQNAIGELLKGALATKEEAIAQFKTKLALNCADIKGLE